MLTQQISDNQKKFGLEYFTLIELLVVISIIAVLTSLLLPAFKKARTKTNQIVCMSQEKQMGVATNFYCNDYNDYFQAEEEYTKPIFMLYKCEYIKKALLLCPGSSEHGIQYGYVGPEGMLMQNDYIYNCALTGKITPAWDTTTGPIKRTLLKMPSVDIALLDGKVTVKNTNEWVGYGTLPIYILGFNPVLSSSSFWDSVRHFGFVNVLFADGHVGMINNPSKYVSDYRKKGDKNSVGWYINN